MSPSDLARQLAARRRIVESVCAVCGAPIRGTTYRSYCSNRCRSAARRQRLKDAKAQAESAKAKG